MRASIAVLAFAMPDDANALTPENDNDFDNTNKTEMTVDAHQSITKETTANYTDFLATGGNDNSGSDNSLDDGNAGNPPELGNYFDKIKRQVKNMPETERAEYQDRLATVVFYWMMQKDKKSRPSSFLAELDVSYGTHLMLPLALDSDNFQTVSDIIEAGYKFKFRDPTNPENLGREVEADTANKVIYFSYPEGYKYPEINEGNPGKIKNLKQYAPQDNAYQYKMMQAIGHELRLAWQDLQPKEMQDSLGINGYHHTKQAEAYAFDCEVAWKLQENYGWSDPMEALKQDPKTAHIAKAFDDVMTGKVKPGELDKDKGDGDFNNALTPSGDEYLVASANTVMNDAGGHGPFAPALASSDANNDPAVLDYVEASTNAKGAYYGSPMMEKVAEMYGNLSPTDKKLISKALGKVKTTDSEGNAKDAHEQELDREYLTVMFAATLSNGVSGDWLRGAIADKVEFETAKSGGLFYASYTSSSDKTGKKVTLQLPNGKDGDFSYPTEDQVENSSNILNFVTLMNGKDGLVVDGKKEFNNTATLSSLSHEVRHWWQDKNDLLTYKYNPATSMQEQIMKRRVTEADAKAMELLAMNDFINSEKGVEKGKQKWTPLFNEFYKSVDNDNKALSEASKSQTNQSKAAQETFKAFYDREDLLELNDTLSLNFWEKVFDNMRANTSNKNKEVEPACLTRGDFDNWLKGFVMPKDYKEGEKDYVSAMVRNELKGNDEQKGTYFFTRENVKRISEKAKSKAVKLIERIFKSNPNSTTFDDPDKQLDVFESGNQSCKTQEKANLNDRQSEAKTKIAAYREKQTVKQRLRALFGSKVRA